MPKQFKNISKPVIISVSPQWATEFRGFFLGEGCVSLVKVRRRESPHPTYSPQLHIRLRADERPLLDEIKDKLGGNIQLLKGRRMLEGYECRPACTWQVTGWNRIRAILEACLLGSVLRAKKAVEFGLLYEVILLRYEWGYYPTIEQRAIMDDYHLRIKQAKRF